MWAEAHHGGCGAAIDHVMALDISPLLGLMEEELQGRGTGRVTRELRKTESQLNFSLSWMMSLEKKMVTWMTTVLEKIQWNENCYW